MTCSGNSKHVEAMSLASSANNVYFQSIIVLWLIIIICHIIFGKSVDTF